MLLLLQLCVLSVNYCVILSGLFLVSFCDRGWLCVSLVSVCALCLNYCVMLYVFLCVVVFVCLCVIACFVRSIV